MRHIIFAPPAPPLRHLCATQVRNRADTGFAPLRHCATSLIGSGAVVVQCGTATECL